MLTKIIFKHAVQITTRKQKDWWILILFFSVESKVGGFSKQGRASDCDMARYHEHLHETHHYQTRSLMPAENSDVMTRKGKKCRTGHFKYSSNRWTANENELYLKASHCGAIFLVQAHTHVSNLVFFNLQMVPHVIWYPKPLFKQFLQTITIS